MNQHSPHADLPTLSSTSPITATRTQLQPPPSQTNTTTHHHHRRRRILHPNGTHPTSEPTPAELRDAAARSAKLSIREKLREDWEWDPAASLLHRLQDSPPCDPTTTNGTINGNGNAHNPHDDADDTVSDDSNSTPSTWLEREPDSSDASTTTSDPAHHPSTSQTYKFDTPDSLTTHILSRKRVRRLALDDEMRWNDGLRTFVLRRDDWTGGRVKLVHHTLPPAPVTLRHPPPPADSSTAQPTTVAIKTELVPLAPPLLPHTHPIRANINPQTYPSIYSKVVVQGLAPTVPINLRDMTSALVVGWKEDDLWPPKDTAVPEAAVAVRRKGRGGDAGGGGGGGGDGGGRNGEREKGERERGLAKGVGAFKRALGLGVGVGGNVERGSGRESGTV